MWAGGGLVAAALGGGGTAAAGALPRTPGYFDTKEFGVRGLGC
ncbi:hypothetical protein SAMN04488021_1521 [Paracoccus aminovorans]|uniref:Uncharacterized protein n=1 Tax=Paracoccus aminovorans TaxID=34004 RepID=A0A1I3EPT9_9RHOB|nr:hypothetical protein SAMN04488021_1521 [Paracoccus aminovorans]